VKKILFLVVFVLAFLAFNLEVQAAPFVVSDAYPTAATQPDGFAVSLDGGPVVEAPADPVTSSTVRFKFDVGAVESGSHTLRVKAYKQDAVWGRLESTEAVFTFARPAAPAVPGGLQLAP
jgi:hypothetical protein